MLAEQKEDENIAFRMFLKNSDLSVEEMDEQVFELTKRVWAQIDCTTCANCCKESSPPLSEEDVERLAKRLGIERQVFIDTYLEKAERGDDDPWTMRALPCPFLQDNRCSVYEDRPAACKDYPYLYKPQFVFRTMGMVGRTTTCPIVFEVLEALKPRLGFRYRARRKR
ncbi:MAG TPA: YkgJ family cysteine cluster protein [Humisphaera sp.]|nr:YkgJ family cysteine cluster protein [Humisphaera sp.]